jgi:hypothetical protein
MSILSQFLLRLAFGLAVGMGLTSPRYVASGFFRNHLYVTLGLTTLATLVIGRVSRALALPAACAAVSSFIGSACWLYESKRAGVVAIWLVAVFALLGACMESVDRYEAASFQNTTVAKQAPTESSLHLMRTASVATSGLVLGLTFASMLLGHWYLNSPGMELAPLRRLLVAASAAIVVHALVCGTGLALEVSSRPTAPVDWLLFLLLRWSFGIVGVLVLLRMAWQTLKIPNTQSATGILYVAVIGVFVGELTGLLLSAESAYPL